MPKATRAVVFHGPGRPLETIEVPLPTLAPGEVLVAVTCCTLCSADVSFLGVDDDSSEAFPPTILGHEALGRVAALPDGGATDHAGVALAIGDRVTWSAVASCGGCPYCASGVPARCERLFMYGREPLGDGRVLTGGLADHCHLTARTAVLRVPELLPDDIAAPANCATATAAAALRRAGDVQGEVVLIQGAGLAGLTAALMARTAGAREVVVADLDGSRLGRVDSFGGTVALLMGNEASALGDEVRALSEGRGADVVLDMCGDTGGVEQGLEALRVGGRAVWAGPRSPANRVRVRADRVVGHLLAIEGVSGHAPRDLMTGLEFLAQHASSYPFAEIVECTFKLDQAREALQYTQAMRPLRVAIRPRPEEDSGA